MRRVVTSAALLLTLAACRDTAVTLLPQGDLPRDIYGSPVPQPTTELPRRGTVYMIRDGRLAPVLRPLQGVARSLPEALLLTLLQGPAGVRDATTAIPPDTRINDIQVVDGIATVDLSEEFEQGGSGRALALRVAQVVFALTEDRSVEGVLFSIEGIPGPVVTGGGEVVFRPVTREDYGRFTGRAKKSSPKSGGAGEEA